MTIAADAPGFLSLGQPTARAIALRAAAAGRLQRTLLVHGPAGANKDAFVDDILALAFCTDADKARRPCNACRGCGGARARNHPDLVIGSPAGWRAERSTGESIVAAARRWLLDAAGAPIVAERRVVLIERADAANEQTQNALLKALEEPTSRHMFVLVADEPARLLPTIRSRCQALRIGPVAREELAAWLVDRERLPADQADILAMLAGGLAGTAIGYARNPESVAWRRRVQAELLSLLWRGRGDRFAAVAELIDQAARLGMAPPADDAAPAPDDDAGDRPARAATGVQREAALGIVEAWLGLTRDLLVVAAGGPEAISPAAELVGADVVAAARRVGPHDMVAMARMLERVHDGLVLNAAPRLALQAAMLAWPSLEPTG